jgi:hypothetical protein
MGPYRVKLDEETSKRAALAGENSFEQAYLHSLLRLEKCNQGCAPARKECNKYNLTAGPCFLISQRYSKWRTLQSKACRVKHG